MQRLVTRGMLEIAEAKRSCKRHVHVHLLNSIPLTEASRANVVTGRVVCHCDDRRMWGSRSHLAAPLASSRHSSLVLGMAAQSLSPGNYGNYRNYDKAATCRSPPESLSANTLSLTDTASSS
jgi:hypothetical protein